jgi:hypothetical protein
MRTNSYLTVSPSGTSGSGTSTRSFAEPDNRAGDDKSSIWTWFARDDSRPPMFFAGI